MITESRGGNKFMKAKQYKMPKHAHEDVEQGYLMQWAARQECVYPELWLLHHIPNEGKRSPRTGARLKRQGLKPGVPDLSLPVPRGHFHGLYIELKVNDNTTTDDQDEWLERLAEQGYSTHACWGWEEAAKVIENYLKSKRSVEA
jgi:hypothetical protein